MIRSVLKACPIAIAVVALSSVPVYADPLTDYDSAGCVYTAGWPRVGSQATCTTDTNVCVYTSTETGVSKVCYP